MQAQQLKAKKTRTARPGAANNSMHETVSPMRGQEAPSMSSGPPVFYDRDEIINEQQELCKKIDQFFSAMKLLQRAVNRKEDISSLKVDFETKQRAL